MIDTQPSRALPIYSIIIKVRTYKNFGDIEIAESVSTVGLLQPIIINESNESQIKAYIQLGRTEIPTYRISLEEIILDELHANSNRKDFTTSDFIDNRSIDSDHGLDPVIVQTLEGYVLPLLPEVPLHIHKMQFKVRIHPEYYQEIVLTANHWNKGKEHEELIGRTLVRYRFYANGTVVVSTESSNNPFLLATELDCSNFMAFLGQVRDRLVLFLADKHERIVPEILDWELTQCDLNKDIRIEKWLQSTGLSIQVRHMSHLFRVYIKSKGKDTVCRVEESISFKDKSVVKSINEIFNPTQKLEKQIAELSRKVDQLFYGNDIRTSKSLVVEYDGVDDITKMKRSVT